MLRLLNCHTTSKMDFGKFTEMQCISVRKCRLPFIERLTNPRQGYKRNVAFDWFTAPKKTKTKHYKFRHAEFVKEAMRVFDGYPHKEYLLGLNIKQLRFDLGDDFNKKNEYLSQNLILDKSYFPLKNFILATLETKLPTLRNTVIPICGSKNKGKIYSWASLQVDQEKETQSWRVDRLDLMVHKKDPFTFYMHPDADYVKDITLKEGQLIRDR